MVQLVAIAGGLSVNILPARPRDYGDLQMLRPRVALPTAFGATLEPLVEALATPSSLSGGPIRIGRGAILASGSGVVGLAVIVPAISLGGLGGGVPATGGVLHVAWRDALHMLTGAAIGLP